MGIESLCLLVVVVFCQLASRLCLFVFRYARDETDCISLSNSKSEKTTNSLHPLPTPVPFVYIQNSLFCLFNVSNNRYCQIQVLFLKFHLSFIKLGVTRKYNILTMNLKTFPFLG